jgi:hypothetical protein
VSESKDGCASARKDAHSSADRSAGSVAEAASVVRPATSPFLYKIAAWETGGGKGKAGSAAGADSSGPIGADGSGTAIWAGRAVAEDAPSSGAAPSRLAYASWTLTSLPLGIESTGGAGTLGGSTPRVKGDLRSAARPGAGSETFAWGARSASLRAVFGGGCGGCLWGVHATNQAAPRQTAPATARSGPNRKIFMGPVPLREDGPVLVNNM